MEKFVLTSDLVNKVITTAADAAGYAAARDKTLKTFATIAEDILIDMGVPAVSFLSLI